MYTFTHVEPNKKFSDTFNLTYHVVSDNMPDILRIQSEIA